MQGFVNTFMNFRIVIDIVLVNTSKRSPHDQGPYQCENIDMK